MAEQDIVTSVVPKWEFRCEPRGARTLLEIVDEKIDCGLSHALRDSVRQKLCSFGVLIRAGVGRGSQWRIDRTKIVYCRFSMIENGKLSFLELPKTTEPVESDQWRRDLEEIAKQSTKNQIKQEKIHESDEGDNEALMKKPLKEMTDAELGAYRNLLVEKQKDALARQKQAEQDLETIRIEVKMLEDEEQRPERKRRAELARKRQLLLAKIADIDAEIGRIT